MINITYQVTKPPPGTQLNLNHPLAQGLVACWLFNEGSGLRANDLTQNQNTGTLANFEPFSSTRGWSGTNQGTGMLFDGVTASNINCGNKPSLQITNTLTLEAFVYPRIAAVIAVVFKRIQQTAALGWSMHYLASTRFELLIGNGATATFTSSNRTYPINNWYHVVMTYNKLSNGISNIYVNSVLDRTNTSVSLSDSGSNTFIGSTGTGNLWNGFISFVRVYNTVKTQDEVRGLYAQPFSMFNTTIARR